jgi:hypothetical protein
LLASPAHISGHITATHKPVESCLWIQTWISNLKAHFCLGLN